MTSKYQGKDVQSGIWKHPVFTPVWLSSLRFAGDEQVDKRFHGGKDKAVCVYPVEHYANWQDRLGKSLNPGAFGENLTTLGLLENEVCIGDIYSIGGARVQVTQARQPCFKLAMKHGVREFPSWVEQSRKTGFYFRVLKEGYIAPADSVLLVHRTPQNHTVADAFKVMTDGRADSENIRALLENDGLSDDWKTTLQKRLDNFHSETVHSE